MNLFHFVPLIHLHSSPPLLARPSLNIVTLSIQPLNPAPHSIPPHLPPPHHPPSMGLGGRSGLELHSAGGLGPEYSQVGFSPTILSMVGLRTQTPTSTMLTTNSTIITLPSCHKISLKDEYKIFLLQSKWCADVAVKPWSPLSRTPAHLDSSTWIPTTQHLDSSNQPPQITFPPHNLLLTPVHW